MKVRFGPAGIPIQCNSRSTIDGIKCCSDLGLDAMEMEFVQGVRLKEPAAEEIGKVAKELDIKLSSHAPYFVNFCSDDKQKIATSSRNLIQAADITAVAGGTITVFHPGFYQKKPPEEAYKIAKKNIEETISKLDDKLNNKLKNEIILGAETVGKKSQFGGLDEVIKLSIEIPKVKPVLDFAHIHARGDAKLKEADDYKRVFDKIEAQLPGYLKHFHAHFSEINYTEKGERNHLPLGERNEPPFRPLLKVIEDNGYSGVIICESPQLDLDAQKMQRYYEGLLKK